MNLPGLHHQITRQRKAAAELAQQARRPPCDPRTSHEIGVRAERLALDADRMADHLLGNQTALEGILQLVSYLTASPHQSRHRSLALTALENAAARLLFENGTPEI